MPGTISNPLFLQKSRCLQQFIPLLHFLQHFRFMCPIQSAILVSIKQIFYIVFFNISTHRHTTFPCIQILNISFYLRSLSKKEISLSVNQYTILIGFCTSNTMTVLTNNQICSSTHIPAQPFLHFRRRIRIKFNTAMIKKNHIVCLSF